MNTASTSFLVIALAASLLDWFAVARKSERIEYLAKPLATAAFLATAASLDVAHEASRTWHLVALAFCILGDVFLMLPRDSFVPGLGSFAVAQVLFTVSYLSADVQSNRLLIGLLIAIPVTAGLARRYVGALRRAERGDLVAPVIVYMIVISAMAVAAIAGGSAVAVAGAVVFMVSDSLIAETRFVKERAWQPVGIMVTYHAALAGLVLGLL